MEALICEKCGHTLRLGDYPFCKGRPSDHDGYGCGIVRDEIVGGQVIENLGHEPVTVYSQSELRREAEARGLRLTDCWAGPGDRHLSNWAAGIDAYTLESARLLLERGSRVPESPSPGLLETFRGEVREIKRLPS